MDQINLYQIFVISLVFILSLHPLYNIYFHPEYRCLKNGSYYLEFDNISNFFTKKTVILLSIILFVFMLMSINFLLGIPLLVLTWVCFIRDRFKSLARGSGAPGYFCFFSTLSLTLLIFYFSSSKSWIIFISQILFTFAALEFGFIFLSAGLFKCLDCINNPISFSLGMLNPIWSKIYKFNLQVQFLRPFINWLGPLIQLISGIFIISNNSQLQKIGYLLIALSFLAITPFCILGWLCPSIALVSILFYSFNEIFITSLPVSVFICLRFYITFCLFSEYFIKTDRFSNFIKPLIFLYRYLFGLIIWKVFTYDVVQFIAIVNKKKLLELSEKNLKEDKQKDEIKEFIFENSSSTNVYNSITLSALLSSSNYLPLKIFNGRINKFCEVKNINEFYFLICKSKNAFISYKVHPFKDVDLKKINYDKNVKIVCQNKSFTGYKSQR